MEEVERKALLNELRERGIDESTCFLCGDALEEVTDEHVIPKWVQRKFDLWNERLILLNHTSMPYRQLTIPCCDGCNSEHLSPIENSISRAVAAGPAAVRSVGDEVLFIWLTKILYGLMYRETLLLADQRDRESGPIVEPDYLRDLSMFHYFLQGARRPFAFPAGPPASIFVVEVLDTDDYPFSDWHIRTDAINLAIAVKLGNVGIIALLQDGGAQRDGFGDYVAEFQGVPLHPIQFIELTAKAFYKNHLQTSVPKFVLMERSDSITAIQTPLAGLSGMVQFDDWEHETYVNLLSDWLGFQVAFVPPDKYSTWLKTGDLVVRYRDGEFVHEPSESAPVELLGELEDRRERYALAKTMMEADTHFWERYHEIARTDGLDPAIDELEAFLRSLSEQSDVAEALASEEEVSELLRRFLDGLEQRDEYSTESLASLGLGAYRGIIDVLASGRLSKDRDQ